MCRLLQNPLRRDLADRITQMPVIEAAVKAGTATLSDHYALARVICCQHDAAIGRPLTRSGTPASP